MSRTLNVACLQTRPQPSFDAANAHALSLARKAVTAGAEFLALPEYCGGLKSENGLFAPPSAHEEEHPCLAAFKTFAADERVWMLIGSIAIKGPDGLVVNRGYLLDADGEIVARYDKIHLFDVDLSETESYRESAVIAPGSEAVLATLPWGRAGLSICYDLRFPQLYRDLAQSGAEMLAVPAAFTKVTGQAHWHVLNRARAIENGAFVVAPCAFGSVDGGGECFGHSLIVDPWGKVLADGGEKVGVVSCQIDLDEVAVARMRIPSLKHDRAFDSARLPREVKRAAS